MRPWLRWIRRLFLAGAAFGLFGVLTLAAVIWTAWPQLPDVRELRRVELALPLSVYSADGKLISLFGEIGAATRRRSSRFPSASSRPSSRPRMPASTNTKASTSKAFSARSG